MTIVSKLGVVFNKSVRIAFGTTIQSNSSRCVTKIRWPVEVVHGIISKKFKFLHSQFDNELLPKVGLIARAVSLIYSVND